jgi:hypothetical protein
MGNSQQWQERLSGFGEVTIKEFISKKRCDSGIQGELIICDCDSGCCRGANQNREVSK